MSKRPLGLISLGISIMIVAVCLVAYASGYLGPFGQMETIYKLFAMIIALYGVWMMILAGIRFNNPEKYERGAFSTLTWGVLFVAIGGSIYLYLALNNWIYPVALLLAVIGILVLVAAARMWRK
jgi:uncharacterized membrane protein YidH (DUF202 family)